jgi:hypothetical protein
VSELSKLEYANAMYPHYITAMLWSTTDSHNDEYNDSSFSTNGYSIDDIDPEFEAVCRADILSFVNSAWPWLTKNRDWEQLDPEQAGHDFWLTREGHGAGFWDRDLGSRGDVLTDKCKKYGEIDIYAINGKIIS